MSAAILMTDLARLDIRLQACGDRLRYTPRSAVTPNLAERMKAHKGELLAMLAEVEPAPVFDIIDPFAGQQPPERVQHKREGCTSTETWRHRWGGRYCPVCWPCTDALMMVRAPGGPAADLEILR